MKPADERAEPIRRRMDGREFLEWIMARPGAARVKARALAAAHKLGYSARIWTWSPAQVEAVLEAMALQTEWGRS